MKSFLYFAPSQVPLPPHPHLISPISQAIIPLWTVQTNQLSAHLQSHFSIQTPKSFHTSEKIHMNKIKSAHCNLLHPTFCSPFTSLESKLWTRRIFFESNSDSTCLKFSDSTPTLEHLQNRLPTPPKNVRLRRLRLHNLD